METAQQGISIQEALGNIADTSDPHNFRVLFRRMRTMFPEEVAAACLWYIAERGVDSAGLTMAFWITLKSETLNVLFDPNALSAEIASKAALSLKKADADFPLKFLKAAEQISSPPLLLRALSVAPALGDYGILLSWLRKLSHHSDQRVKSRAVRLLCELRPNKSQIERQMQADDPRVRASAIEALWYARSPEISELFRSAARDVHHRVVGNALVGLYLQGDHSVLDRMIELCDNQDAFYRAAMAWCFGFIGDSRAIPYLQNLTNDSSIMVRKRALKSLLKLQPDETIALETTTAPEEPASLDSDEAPVIENKPDVLPVPRFASLS